MTGYVGNKRRVLILVENLPSPFDRRVWQEATTLKDWGYEVTIICPTGKGYESTFDIIDGIHIHRYDLPIEASTARGYLIEYSVALFHSFRLAWKSYRTRGFDVVHACNPPDLLFIVGGFFKLFFDTKCVFDHHDINPELYEAKFGKKRGILYKALLLFERLSFSVSDVSIATNESYRKIAIERGKMDKDKVFVVRSGPNLDRMRIVPPRTHLKKGRTFLVGYVGVIGQQEGIDLLLHAVRFIVKDLGRMDIHFGIVGGGTSLAEMKQLAVELEVHEFVTFTGRVSDNDLLEMLNTADVCVNPDVANEMNDKSTMNKIMEYMALGKPIVQFDLTEGRVSAGDASVYARKNDWRDLGFRIVELLDAPERRREMGRIGRDRVVNELQWAHEVPKLLATYEAVFKDQVLGQRQVGRRHGR